MSAWTIVAACGDTAPSPELAVDAGASLDAGRLDTGSSVDAAAADASAVDAPSGDATSADAGSVDAAVDVTSAPDGAADGGSADASDAALDAVADGPTTPDAGTLILCGTINTLFGAPVALQSPTATFSQTVFETTAGQYSVAKAVDGVLDTTSGWAIASGGGGTTVAAETAAFETTLDTPAFVGGTRLVFVLKHAFSAAEHALGRFRLLATTSPRTAFADGNVGTSTPGDVGTAGIWTVLAPKAQCATNGATMTVLNDSSIRVADLNTATVSYVVEVDTSLVGITGIRLEVLKDAALPNSGPGLQNLNGNFVLSELVVRAGNH